MSEENKTVELKEDELNQTAGGSNPLVKTYEEYYCTICGYVISRREINISGLIISAFQTNPKMGKCPCCNRNVEFMNRIVRENQY